MKECPPGAQPGTGTPAFQGRLLAPAAGGGVGARRSPGAQEAPPHPTLAQLWAPPASCREEAIQPVEGPRDQAWGRLSRPLWHLLEPTNPQGPRVAQTHLPLPRAPVPMGGLLQMPCRSGSWPQRGVSLGVAVSLGLRLHLRVCGVQGGAAVCDQVAACALEALVTCMGAWEVARKGWPRPGTHFWLPLTGAPEGEPEYWPLVGTPGTTAGGPRPPTPPTSCRVAKQPLSCCQGPRCPCPVHTFFAFVLSVAPGNSRGLAPTARRVALPRSVRRCVHSSGCWVTPG